MIKKFFVFLIGLILIVPFITAEGIRNESKQPQVPAKEKIDSCFIIYAEGEVFFQNFTKAEVNMEVLPGDELITKKGRAEIYLENGSFLRMDRNTRVVFVALGENMVLLGMWEGSIYIQTGNSTIEVQTPYQNYMLKNGLYRIDVEKNRTKVYQNPRVADSFDSWSYDRENELNRPLNTEISYPYGLYSYHSWRWHLFLLYWNPYFLWNPFWSPIWNSYHDYFSHPYYSQPRTTVRTVRKNQLQAPSQIKSPTFPSRINRSNVTAQTRTPIRAPQSQLRRSTPSHLTQRLSAPRSFSRPQMSRPIQKRIVRKK